MIAYYLSYDTFYFRQYDMTLGLRITGEPLASFEGTTAELRAWLEARGERMADLVFAVFDHSTRPVTLHYRARGVRFTFAEARKLRPDFPAFFIDKDGCIWASDDMDDWGKVGKQPVMASDSYCSAVSEAKRLGLRQRP